MVYRYIRASNKKNLTLIVVPPHPPLTSSTSTVAAVAGFRSDHQHFSFRPGRQHFFRSRMLFFFLSILPVKKFWSSTLAPDLVFHCRRQHFGSSIHTFVCVFHRRLLIGSLFFGEAAAVFVSYFCSNSFFSSAVLFRSNTTLPLFKSSDLMGTTSFVGSNAFICIFVDKENWLSYR